MASRLINVRLDEDRLRKAQHLRRYGVVLSDVVREAIDERFTALQASRRPRDVAGILERIYSEYPDPPDAPRRDYDVHDPHEAREAIRERLRRSRA